MTGRCKSCNHLYLSHSYGKDKYGVSMNYCHCGCETYIESNPYPYVIANPPNFRDINYEGKCLNCGTIQAYSAQQHRKDVISLIEYRHCHKCQQSVRCKAISWDPSGGRTSNKIATSALNNPEIFVRHPTRCRVCGGFIRPGEKAWWNADVKRERRIGTPRKGWSEEGAEPAGVRHTTCRYRSPKDLSPMKDCPGCGSPTSLELCQRCQQQEEPKEQVPGPEDDSVFREYYRNPAFTGYIFAKFNSSCMVCRDSIRVGDRVWYESSPTFVCHPDCRGKASAPTKACKLCGGPTKGYDLCGPCYYKQQKGTPILPPIKLDDKPKESDDLMKPVQPIIKTVQWKTKRDRLPSDRRY